MNYAMGCDLRLIVGDRTMHCVLSEELFYTENLLNQLRKLKTEALSKCGQTFTHIDIFPKRCNTKYPSLDNPDEF